jgi:hypothetical protein
MRIILFIFIVCFSCVPPRPVSVLDLNLLPQSASLPAKIDFYDNYKITETVTKSVYQGTYSSVSYTYIQSVVLSNGNEIYEHKLLADKMPGTIVEEHYKNALTLAEQTKKPKRLGRIVLIAGLITSPLIFPLFIGILVNNAITKNNNITNKKVLRELDLVFLTYNETLRKKLNLCVDPTIVTVEGEALVECLTVTP